MLNSEIEIKNIDLHDCPEVTHIHMKAFPKSSLTKLGAEAVRRYYAAQMVEPNDCVALGAFQEGVMQGFIYAGFFHGILSGFVVNNKWFLVGRVLTHPWLILNPMFRDAIKLALKKLQQKKSVQIIQKRLQPKEQDFVVLAIAVNPGNQKSGIGQLLMDHAEKKAIEHGSRKMSLTVNSDNTSAIRFYEKKGWEVKNKTSTRNIQMVKQINGSQ